MTEDKMNSYKRVNHFQGQFLDKDDFNEAHEYHVKIRRRLNYGLYKYGIIDGLDFDETTTGTIFKITRGMALDRLERLDDGTIVKYSREIILLDDYSKDLVNELGYSVGESVYITISYDEKNDDKETVAGYEDYSRKTEQAVIKTWLDTGTLPGTRFKDIIIGKATINVDSTLSYDRSAREIGGIGTTPVTKLVSISVEPASITTLIIGDKPIFKAIGTFDNGTIRQLTSSTDGLQWESSNKVVVEINPGTGEAEALSKGGPVTITAAVDTIKSTAMINEVKEPAAKLVSISVQPLSIDAFTVGNTQQFVAIGTFDNGTSRQLTTAEDELHWLSSDPAVVSIGSNTGMATALKAGISITITARVDVISGTATINKVGEKPIFLKNIPGTPGTEIDPHVGAEGDEIKLYGRYFSADSPSNPTVELLDSDQNVLHVFRVKSITSHTSGTIEYKLMKVEVREVDSEKMGKISVSTSFGNGTTTENFSLIL